MFEFTENYKSYSCIVVESWTVCKDEVNHGRGARFLI